MSTLSLIPEEKKFLSNSSKSTESLYSSSSSKYSATALYKRKVTSIRQPGFIPAQNEVRQRVLSARRLRMKTLQNQLADAQQHIAELANENRVLRTVHKRQDSALSKYEGTSAELPQLLHSHSEEIRIWQAKYRNLHNQNKELSKKLKDRDTMILALGDQNKHLTQLNKDKNLEDRERLADRVRYLERRLSERENDLKLLARRLQLEAKNFKAQLAKEQQKYKQLLHRLHQARIDTDKLSQFQFDMKERQPQVRVTMPRSLSGSKLPKSVKERERNRANGERENNNAKASLSSPSLCLDYPTYISEINPSKLTSSSSSTNQTKTMTEANKSMGESRQTSAPRKSRRDQDNSFNAADLSDSIAKGMSKLLSSNKIDKDKVCLNGNEVLDQEDLLDQSEPEDYFNEYDVDQNFENGDDYLGSDNDSSADVIVGGKAIETVETEVIVQQTQVDFANIEKQMSDDYRQRESFLDSFCRQTTSIEKEFPTRRSTNIDSKKKDQLLAALKAIESQEDDQ